MTDGQELALGPVQLRMLHTPGHRPELISILIANTVRAFEPLMVLTGYSLLAGDVGRPDFGGGDAAVQYMTVQRLLELPDWVAVFPGHFEGPCAQNMAGNPSTTIGYERRFNPVVRLDRAHFLDVVAGHVPARPLNMTAIEATNRGKADLSWSMPAGGVPVPEIDVDAFAAELTSSQDPFVLDVREPEEYVQGHVPASINLPQAELALRLDEIPRDQPVYVLCTVGARSLRAAQFLKQVGFDQVANVRGGTAAWRRASKPLAFGQSMNTRSRVAELAEATGDAGMLP